jgi:hypothetical protein
MALRANVPNEPEASGEPKVRAEELLTDGAAKRRPEGQPVGAI